MFCKNSRAHRRDLLDQGLEYQQIGLKPPASVVAATERYREEQDLLGGFLTEVCVLAGDARITRSELRRAYDSWAESMGERNPLGPKLFTEKLRERGLEEVSSVRSRTGTPERGWRGVRLKSSEERKTEAEEAEEAAEDAKRPPQKGKVDT